MENEMIIQTQETEEPVNVAEMAVEEQTSEPVAEDLVLEQVETKKKKKKTKKGKKPINPLVLASFITSVVFFFFHGIIGAPIVSIVLAIVGLIKGKKKGMGGVVFGVVAILLSVLTLIISSGDIVVYLLKAYYVIVVFWQSILSIVDKFNSDVFEFLGEALLVIRYCWAGLAAKAKSALGFTTIYELLGGKPGKLFLYNNVGEGISRLLYNIAEMLRNIM